MHNTFTKQVHHKKNQSKSVNSYAVEGQIMHILMQDDWEIEENAGIEVEYMMRIGKVKVELNQRGW